MQTYLGGLQSFSADYDVEIDVITQEGEKLKFSSSGEILVQRPGQALRDPRRAFRRRRGHPRWQEPDDLRQGAERLHPVSGDDRSTQRSTRSATIPASTRLAPIFWRRSRSTPTVTDFVSGVHVGMTYVGGVEAHHLAFRGKTGRLAALGAGRRPAAAAQIRDHQQMETRRARIHAASQQLERGAERRRRALHLHAPGGCQRLTSVEIDEIGQFIDEAE